MNLRIIVLLLALFMQKLSFAQQDPHFTQYMHNTTIINPAFTGSLGQPVITAVERIQWAGVEGAPHTQSLSFHTPIRRNNFGLGLNIINDAIGPLNEVYIDATSSYAIILPNETRLAFGMKLGGRYFSVDRSKIILEEQNDNKIQNNINELFITVGAGLYFNSERFYFGVSVPNLIPDRVYSGGVASGSIVEMNYQVFTMLGYAFDINYDVRFKPAVLLKVVEGAKPSVDLSANFLMYNRMQTGLSYRIDDAISASIGFDVSDNIYIGYSYDLTTSPYRIVNNGSHEIVLKYKGNTPRRRFSCEGGGLAWF